MRLNIFYLLTAFKRISNVFSIRCVQRVFVETQLDASEGNVAVKGGKGDRRDLPKRHQSFARALTWCPAVCVPENNGPSPSPSPGALQYMSRKVSILHPGTLLLDLLGALGIFPISVVSPLAATFPSEAFN